MPRRNELAPEAANALLDAYATPAGAVTANPRILRQAARNRQAYERPQAQGTGGAMEFAANVLMPVPIAGDIAGFANDVRQMYIDPETRTKLNMGLAALGLIPFVPPAVSYGLGKLAQARGVSIAPGPRGPGASQAGIFAGESAKTADMAALANAKQLEAAGENPRQIWSSTGWFKGVDGNWRFEIDDSQAKFNPSGTGADMRENPLSAFDVKGDRGPTVGGLLHHPQLEAAYGRDLTRSTFVDNKNVGVGDLSRGSFNPSTGRLQISAPVSAATGRSTTLHELQHAVQEREGFAQGGMPATARRTVDEIHPPELDATGDEYRALWKSLRGQDRPKIPGGLWRRETDMEDFYDSLDRVKDPAVRKQFEDILDRHDAVRESVFGFDEGIVTQQNNYNAYLKIPGEVEARAVQARMDMTPEQRRAVFPPDSYDTRPAPILYAPGVSRDTVAENVFSSLPDATLYALRKSAQEAAARSNDPAAVFRLGKIDEELARRAPR